MANTWWENAEEGRAARYARDLDNRPTLADCEQDEREIAAMRRTPASEPARDLIADLIASVEAAKAAK